MALIQELAARLAIPGLPAWTGLLALLLLALVGLAYLLMPFAVFGVKGRLETLEAQLDELQAEIRALSLRLGGDAQRRSAALAADDWVEPPSMRRGAGEPEPTPRISPPVPPPAAFPERRGGRSEPRFDLPDRQPR
ncbi:MAG: hypothetical protein K2X74_04755 [Acetobacteraceae bacterium]|nr:hypothetical protein [Acetobacteraceae bacterium]